MKGIIINYRMGRHRIYPNQLIVKFEGIEDKNSAIKLLGKNVVWVSPGKKIFIGKIVDIHGNKGNVRIRFNRGLPGQAIGDIVILIDDINKVKEIREKLKNAKDINQIRKILFEISK
jgi:large subunit ribosomal protein L35Ae